MHHAKHLRLYLSAEAIPISLIHRRIGIDYLQTRDSDSRLSELAPNGTNLGLFKISFSTFWRLAPKCTETDLKKSQICPIWDQSESLKPKSNHKTESDSKYNLHRHLINTIHWDILHYYACLSNNILRSLLRRYKPRHWQRTNYNLHKTPGVRDLATISHSWESNGTFIWTFVGIC